MKTFWPTIGCIFFCAASVFSQDRSPVPKPSATPPDDADVVKISTNLIQLDVTVTDRKGNIVSDLKPEDFEVLENGQKQSITNFSFIASGVREAPVKAAKTDKTLTPIPPTTIRSEQVRRTIALVVDDLGLSFESAYYTRRALKKFVDEQMQDGDLVAIIRTGAGIGALQQFTTDKRMLYAAIERVRWYPSGRGGIGAFAPIAPTMLEEAKASGAPVSDADLESEKKFNNSFDDFRSSTFAAGTLGALRFIIGGMGELPGRKSVIMFSDGFRLLERDSQGFSSGGTVIDFMRKLVDAANRASVVIYTVDPRGLQTLGPTAQDQFTDAQSMQDALAARRDELFETQAGLSYLAEQTGGFAVKNNNDLSGGVRRVLNDQSYYLIGYEPDSDTFDPIKRRFNKLFIKVNRKDVSVRYRSGFFNVAEEKIVKAPPPKSPVEHISAALLSPFLLNEISLSLNTVYGHDAANGNFVRSLLHVNAKDLTFVDGPDGKKNAAFSVLGASFGDNGSVVDQIGRNYTINVDEAGFKRLQVRGFVYHFIFPVKQPGAYQYRVALRDTNSAKVGSASQFIEVPNLKKGNVAVSSLVLQNFSEAQWAKYQNNDAAPAGEPYSSPMDDTSQRRFRTGTVLRYGFEIYNAKLDSARKPNLTTQIRAFRDGKMVLDGQPTPFDLRAQADLKHLKTVGAITLGGAMQPGDYVLQVIVIDNLAKEKYRVGTQYVQFEVLP